jgi:8-oxo-dGTP pyrophosphatase MutT (NUDIX family)/predicted ATPase
MLTHRDQVNHDAVVLVIRDRDDRILCLFHNKFDFWTVPLGKADDGPSPEEAAAAEAYEEVGIEIVRAAKRYQGTKVYSREGKKIVTFFHVFEILKYKGTPYNREPEKHREMRFMSVPELRNLGRTSDGTMMFLALLDELGGRITSRRPNSFWDVFPAELRVGLSGASGAGKTTLARWLKDGYGASLHAESIRTWLVANGNLRYSSLSDEQIVRLQLHLLREYELSQANLFDRSPLDCLHYVSKVAHLIDIGDFRRRAIRLLDQYSAIVFFPPHSPYLVNDGIRIADLKHQTEVAARMFVQACDAGLREKLVVYDHAKTVEENVCQLFEFLAAAHSHSSRTRQ